MNNDELKKKIVETLKNTVINYDCGHAIRAKNFYAERVFERFTDALIDAGIGDVKEAKREFTRIEVLKQERFAEKHGFTPDCSPYYIAERYKYRAKVVERQAKILSEWLSAECKEPKHTAKAWEDTAYLRAEKELVEERK